MSYNNPANKYKQSAVASASREKLLLMIYEAAIKFCKKAIIAAEAKNIGDRGLYIGRVYDIVMELNNTLNFEVGGEIARNLESLYNFMAEELTKANISGDPKHLQTVLKLLTTLNDGWVKAIESLKSNKTDLPIKDEGSK